MCCYNAQIFFWCHVQFHQRPSVQYNIVIWIKDYVKLRGDGWKQMDKWSSGHTFSPTYTPWQKLSRSLRWKSQTKILKSHFCLSLTNSTSIHFFVFSPPPFFLFLSLSLSSPCIVSLIGRQTACKCSNPEKSPGALVIGCALQHCSQSIKARWAPVNSFSLLLLWLWYRHTDSNFALNPSTAVLSFSLCLFHVFSLNFYLHFQSPRLPPPPTLLALKDISYNSHSRLVLSPHPWVLTLKSLRASSTLTHLVLSSEISLTVLRSGEKLKR